MRSKIAGRQIVVDPVRRGRSSARDPLGRSDTALDRKCGSTSGLPILGCDAGTIFRLDCEVWTVCGSMERGSVELSGALLVRRRERRIRAHEPALCARQQLVQPLEPIRRSPDLSDKLHQRRISQLLGDFDQLLLRLTKRRPCQAHGDKVRIGQAGPLRIGRRCPFVLTSLPRRKLQRCYLRRSIGIDAQWERIAERMCASANLRAPLAAPTTNRRDASASRTQSRGLTKRAQCGHTAGPKARERP